MARTYEAPSAPYQWEASVPLPDMPDDEDETPEQAPTGKPQQPQDYLAPYHDLGSIRIGGILGWRGPLAGYAIDTPIVDDPPAAAAADSADDAPGPG